MNVSSKRIILFSSLHAIGVAVAVLAVNSYAQDGVRPSPGAATTEFVTAPKYSGPEPTTPVSAPEDGRTPFRLRANFQADGEGVFLNQLIEPGNDLPRLRLCDAPAFGKSLALKRAEIASLSGSAGFDGTLTNWTGAEVVRISRRVRPLAEKELLELLTTSLQQHYVKELGQLELRLSRLWSAVTIPDEAFTIQVSDLPTSGVSPAFVARFEIQTAYGEHLGTWQVAVQAKVWREVWVARSAIKRGESVRNADLVRDRRDMLLFHEPFAEFSADDSSLEFIETVQPGTPLLARLVKPRSIVHRGQSLAALVRDGALMITLKVEALEDGAAGQSIRVRNPLSRRDLHAKVVDEQNVLVSL